MTSCPEIFKKLLEMVDLTSYDAIPSDVAYLFFMLWSNESFPAWLVHNSDNLEELYDCISDIVVDDFQISPPCIRVVNEYVTLIDRHNLTNDIEPLTSGDSMSTLLKTFINIMLHNTMWNMYSREELLHIHDTIFNCIEFKDDKFTSSLPVDPRRILSQEGKKTVKYRKMDEPVPGEALRAYEHYRGGAIVGPLPLRELQELYITIMKSQEIMNFGESTRKIIRNHLASFLETDGLRTSVIDACMDIFKLYLTEKEIPEVKCQFIMKQLEIYLISIVFVETEEQLAKNIITIPDKTSDILKQLL
jgi:hypothetical protein